MAEKVSRCQNGEKLIKSRERVQKFAEVYTPMRIVKNMCDMMPDAWDDIGKTFLEPTCGNGNFLVEIFERKLKLCKNVSDGLLALSCIYGIDIQADNVEESRQRLFDMFIAAFPSACLRDILLAETVLERNIICGDSLKIMARLAEVLVVRDFRTFPKLFRTFGELRVCGTGNPSPTMLFAIIL